MTVKALDSPGQILLLKFNQLFMNPLNIANLNVTFHLLVHIDNVVKNFKKHNSIVITKPDTVGGRAVLNEHDYIKMTQDISNNTSSFKSLTENWFRCTLRLEDKLNRFLRTFMKKLRDNLFDFLFASRLTRGISCGLPKAHKNECRTLDTPILSAFGTFDYNIRKYLFHFNHSSLLMSSRSRILLVSLSKLSTLISQILVTWQVLTSNSYLPMC